LWDVKNSAAFVDSNYMPEIFYGYYSRDNEPVSRPGRITWTWIYDGRVGLMHESNGDDGSRSRAWNRLYATVRSGAYLGTDHYLTLSPRIWAPPFAVDEFNPDIVHFLGYGTLTAEYGYDPLERPWWGGGHAGVTLGKGDLAGFSHVTVEGFLQWRPAYEDRSFSWWKFTPFFYLQARHGYADTLLSYNKEESSVRIGIAFEDHVEWGTARRKAPEAP
jgi:phospholipase A1